MFNRAASVVGIPKISWYNDFFKKQMPQFVSKTPKKWVKMGNVAQIYAKFEMFGIFLFKRD